MQINLILGTLEIFLQVLYLVPVGAGSGAWGTLKLLCFLGQVEVGVVYSCLEDKMFTARRGKGAFCNEQPLQVSDQTGQ